MKIIAITVTLLLLVSTGVGWWIYDRHMNDQRSEAIERAELKEKLKKELMRKAQEELRAKRRIYKKNSPWHIQYAFKAGDLGQTEDFTKHLLTLALNRTVSSYGSYHLEHVELDSTLPASALEALEQKNVDLIILPGLAPYMQRAKPINIPLVKGILSYHLLELRSGTFNFDDISKQKDLQQHKIQLIFGSALRLCLDKQGFNIAGNPDGADYRFAHIGESTDNKKLSASHCINIAMPRLFYVHKEQSLLHERIQRGLELCLYDGSFERIFNKHCAPILDRAKLEQRNLWTLPNPQINPAISTTSSHLWYQITY